MIVWQGGFPQARTSAPGPAGPALFGSIRDLEGTQFTEQLDLDIIGQQTRELLERQGCRVADHEVQPVLASHSVPSALPTWWAAIRCPQKAGRVPAADADPAGDSPPGSDAGRGPKHRILNSGKKASFCSNSATSHKVYGQGGSRVEALRGVSIAFRESEFVAILGHSGCGKTTLLNLIGGLDQYTSGDLTISGRLHQGLQGPGLGRLPQPLRGLRLPELQPDPPSDRAGQCGAGADPLGRVPRRAAAAGRGGADPGGAGRPAAQKAQPDVRRPDAAGGHRPRPWSTTRKSFWQTSPPARWTPRPAYRSWSF